MGRGMGRGQSASQPVGGCGWVGGAHRSVNCYTGLQTYVCATRAKSRVFTVDSYTDAYMHMDMDMDMCTTAVVA